MRKEIVYIPGYEGSVLGSRWFWGVTEAIEYAKSYSFDCVYICEHTY